MKWLEHRAKLVANLSEIIKEPGGQMDWAIIWYESVYNEDKTERRKAAWSSFRNRELPADFARTSNIKLIQESDTVEQAGQATKEMKFRRRKINALLRKKLFKRQTICKEEQVVEELMHREGNEQKNRK